MSGRGAPQLLATAGGVLGLALALATGAGAQGEPRAGRPDMSEYLPPGEGKALVARECTTCHDLSGTVRLRASKDAWEAVVLDMVARGAPLMIDQADAIIAYLSEVFGPKAPPFVDVNAATADELAKLPGVTPATAERLVVHRKEKGPFASREEVRTLIGADAAAFEKLKWYIRAERPR